MTLRGRRGSVYTNPQAYYPYAIPDAIPGDLAQSIKKLRGICGMVISVLCGYWFGGSKLTVDCASVFLKSVFSIESVMVRL